MTAGPGAVPGFKVCGLTRPEDVRLAEREGSDYLGVVLAPGGRRSLAAADAATLLAGATATRVGVFVDADADTLRLAAEQAGLGVLQLHGDEPPALLRSLRAEGRWPLWKAVRPRSAADFLHAVDRYAAVCDALLLDGWSAQAPGGTGTRFPWEAVAEVREALPAGVRLVVAGGLTAANLPRAAAVLRPDVVDVSSGVESAPGIKDAARLAGFAAAVRALRAAC